MAGVVMLAAAGTARGDSHAVHDAQWQLRTVNTDQLWEVSRGDGVTVAVIDTGVNASHPDLRGRVVPGADFGDGSSGDGTHDPGRDQGHGTQVASVIAGTAYNYDGDGLYGLAPGAKILPLGAYRDGMPDQAAVSRAIRAAVTRGASVMVVPGVGSEVDRSLRSAAQYAIDHDVVVVSGVGDDPTAAGPSYPAAIPGVVAVTATDRAGRVWARAERGPHVAIAAPGVGILAAASDGRYWTGDDTGYAAAWVAAAAALVRATNPDWTAAQAIQKLIDTARHQGAAGRGEVYGYGIVDPLRALTGGAAPVAPNNPLLSPGTPVGPEGTTTEAAASGSTGANDALLRLSVAVTAALGGMLLFLVGLRVLCRTLRPADPLGHQPHEGTDTHTAIRSRSR